MAAAELSDAETREHEPVTAPPRQMPSLGPTRPGEKPRVVVLGTGWAACRLLKDVDTRAYDVVCVSPRNHMVFTPLLASTCVGTLEFRSVVEPLARIANFGCDDDQALCSLGLFDEEKQRLLHCVVVGGDPTGVEFSGELSDFITRDVRQRYAHVKDYVKVTLIEANEILSSFDIGTRVPYGLLVWSTGVGPSEFVKSLDLPKSPGGRIGVDEWLRVPTAPDVFALGDCAGFLEGTGKPVLPALAQVAEREGRYLARLLGRVAGQNGGKAHCAGKADLGEPFVYKHIGSMASGGAATTAIVTAAACCPLCCCLLCSGAAWAVRSSRLPPSPPASLLPAGLAAGVAPCGMLSSAAAEAPGKVKTRFLWVLNTNVMAHVNSSME
ncbi:unnamed protein product [Miscanthus lutarioriparius]|uniref:FAD/NAD(P)-binding domain-containing protein n=1 Tax=Miscanthus lutarioriparius TaxID=422564 RepID=A0A811SJH4_9POAL|nr:unnamed protein product [Miscanthus lutarioriparius]CAD6342991.1 unnamed protein product [Miscanthus lutarioriparius]